MQGYRTSYAMSYILAVLLVLLAGTNAASIVAFKNYKANLNAPVLILDAASLVFPGTHAFRPLVTSVDACRDRCKLVAGCNAFTYCTKQTGCGSGCPAYVQQHPTLPTDAGTMGVSDSAKLPILGFGPFSTTCSGDSWPYGLCTLKTAANPSKVTFFSTNAAEGWVSGTIITPASCKGVPTSTCVACSSSGDNAGCLKCAKSVADQRIPQIKGTSGLLLEGCPRCFTGVTGSKRTSCLNCLLKRQPCSECATRAATGHAVSVCLDCYKAEPAAARASCLSCGNMKEEGQATKCATQCLPKLRKTWCTKAQETSFDSRRANCIKSYSSACQTCTQSSTYATCVKCLVTRPGSSDCEACTLTAQSAQAKCFSCALKTYAQFSPCADCLMFGSQKCLPCVMDPKVSYEAKSWCMGCGNWYSDAAKQQQCYNCLKEKHDDYLGTCSKL